MTAQKQTLPSFASIISVLCIAFYCVGFFRVELQLNEQKERINALESGAEAKLPSNNPNMKIIKNFPGKSGFGNIVKFRKIEMRNFGSRSLHILSQVTECR